ncbi:MAG: hypothetical protein ACKVU4_01760 [Phycisphaerales bacterium]
MGVAVFLVVLVYTQPATVTTDAGFGVRRGPVEHMPDATFFEVRARPVSFAGPTSAGLTGVRFTLSGIHHPTSPVTVGWPMISLELESNVPRPPPPSPTPRLTFQGEEAYLPHFHKTYPPTQRNGMYLEPFDFVCDPARLIEVTGRGSLTADFEGITITFSDDDTAALVAFSRAILTGSPNP